jgi:hypothetical protein
LQRYKQNWKRLELRRSRNEPIRETLFDLLLNAFLQTGLFAIVAASFSRLIAKGRAKYQYFVYLAVFLACMVIPVINTLWKASPTAVEEHSVQRIPSEAAGARFRFWSWPGSPVSTGTSRSGHRSKVGSSVYGACFFCIGWLASAEVFIALTGFGGTRRRLFLP